jgi:hypothetical protein
VKPHMGYGIRFTVASPASCFLFFALSPRPCTSSLSSQEEIEYHCSMYHSANNPPKSMTPAAFDPIFITPSLLFLHLSLSVPLRCKVIVDPLTHSPQRCCGVARDRQSFSPRQNPIFGDSPRKTPSFFPATPLLLLSCRARLPKPPARSTDPGHG